MTSLVDCADELSRIVFRARLLELALIHAPKYAQQAHYTDAVAQQSQDVATDLEELSKALSEAIKGE